MVGTFVGFEPGAGPRGRNANRRTFQVGVAAVLPIAVVALRFLSWQGQRKRQKILGLLVAAFVGISKPVSFIVEQMNSSASCEDVAVQEASC